MWQIYDTELYVTYNSIQIQRHCMAASLEIYRFFHKNDCRDDIYSRISCNIKLVNGLGLMFMYGMYQCVTASMEIYRFSLVIESNDWAGTAKSSSVVVV